MDFNGLEPTDLVDVRCINVEFLEYLAAAQGETLRHELPLRLRPVVAALTGRQIQRLADVPFLLLTLHETDAAYWSRILEELPAHDLFAPGHAALDPLGRIAAAALGFQWQLARKNLYAARLIGGGSLGWCEQLASCTLLRVLQCAAEQPGLMAPRLATHEVFWTRLLGAGLSSTTEVRRAAHLSALQIMLSPLGVSREQRWRSAACYTSVPRLELRGRRVRGEDG